MYQILAKIGAFFISHKFSLEIAGIGLMGITLPELVVADHLVKILVGLATLFIIGRKEYKDRKKGGKK
jgi:hypothetical protein